MDYQVKQLQPNHADHISYYKQKYLEDMFTNESVIAQPKYDGERMLIHIDREHIYCTSRRFSKKTGRYMENQDKLPILEKVWKEVHDTGLNLGYTVIDCECYSKDWSTIVGILHSLPERAVELQKQNTANFAVFDCLYYDGKDVREEDYATRLGYASNVVMNFNYKPIHVVKAMKRYDVLSKVWYDTELENFSYIHSMEDWQQCMQCAIDLGFEGIVIKSLDRKYYDKGASLKCKKFETIDCVVCGYQEGRGKYTGSVGALEVGYYDETMDRVVKISKVNCGTDEDRNFWNEHRNELLNTVVEVKCQEITDRSLRHPVYLRRRDDKDYTTCTKETIFKE